MHTVWVDLDAGEDGEVGWVGVGEGHADFFEFFNDDCEDECEFYGEIELVDEFWVVGD